MAYPCVLLWVDVLGHVRDLQEALWTDAVKVSKELVAVALDTDAQLENVAIFDDSLEAWWQSLAARQLIEDDVALVAQLEQGRLALSILGGVVVVPVNGVPLEVEAERPDMAPRSVSSRSLC
jgi:hypothetical protein